MTRLRRGRGKLAVDPEELRQIDALHRAGEGLIGGDPYKRHARNSLVPPEPAPWFCVAQASPAHWRRLRRFLLEAPVEIEIGAGDGRFILEWAEQHPDRHFLAFEIRLKHVKRVYAGVVERGLDNLWVCDDDARGVLLNIVPSNTVEVVHLLMPDPWWKKRQARRRLISPYMLDVLAAVLKPGGIFRFETDVEGYPELVDMLVADHPAFIPHNPALAERFRDAPLTSRQRWCEEHGVPVHRRYYTRR
ncbi:MAG: hypothetical protein Q9O62_01725 [Ardenticatenia bacterium]|nr:hypothetical protein [Ardenticatenia bacterium]